jgi:Tfp pilus assembly ATPase PilU
MLTLDDSLVHLYRRGVIDRQEMLRVCEQRVEVLQKIGESAPARTQTQTKEQRNNAQQR